MLYFLGLVSANRARADGSRKKPFRSLWAFLLWFGMLSVRAQPNQAAILNIGWRSNQLQLSIQNAVTGRVYQIQQRSGLGSSTAWIPQLLGAPGQTNLT